MQIEVLGPVRVIHGGLELELPGTKPRAIIASLALRPGEVISAAALVDELWGDNPPRTGVNSLQGHIARLRRSIDERTSGVPARDILRTSGSGYLLDIDAQNVDALRFTRTVRGVGNDTVRDMSEQAIAQLSRALGMWSGPALADTGQGLICRTARAKLDEIKLIAEELLIEAKLRHSRHREAVPHLQQLLTQYPLRERFCEQLMLALYRSGRQADAIDIYNQVRTRLRDELGLEPGPGMRDRLGEILHQDKALAVAAH